MSQKYTFNGFPYFLIKKVPSSASLLVHIPMQVCHAWQNCQHGCSNEHVGNAEGILIHGASSCHTSHKWTCPLLISAVKNGSNASKQSRKTYVGIGSREHDLAGDSITNLRTSPSNAGVVGKIAIFNQCLASSRVVNGTTAKCYTHSCAGPRQVGDAHRW